MVATAGDTALIIVAALWGAARPVPVLVLANTFRVLESTKMTIDAMREETVPLLREVKTSVEKTNREIDRVDIVLGVGRIDRRAGRAALRAGRGGRDEPAREAHRLGRRGAQGVRQGRLQEAEEVGPERRAPAVLARARASASAPPARSSLPAGPGEQVQRAKPAAIAREARGGLLDLSKLVAESIEEGQARRRTSASESSARSTTCPAPGAA